MRGTTFATETISGAAGVGSQRRPDQREIATAGTRFHREQHGKGPTEVRAHIIGDLIIVRCRGALTPTEVKLSRTDAGCKLLKSARQELLAINHK